MNPVKKTVLAVCAIGAIAFGAEASPVTLDVEGYIDIIFGSGGTIRSASISVGDAVSLRFTYDPATMILDNASTAPPAFDAYLGPINYLLTLPAYSRVGQTNVGVIAVYNDSTFHASTDAFDRLSFATNNIDSADQTNPPFDLGGGPYFENADFTLEDDTATALGSFAIPTTIPFSGFQRQFLNLDFSNGQQTVIAQAEVTITESSPAPELDTWALLIAGFGICGIGLRFQRLPMFHFRSIFGKWKAYPDASPTTPTLVSGSMLCRPLAGHGHSRPTSDIL